MSKDTAPFPNHLSEVDLGTGALAVVKLQKMGLQGGSRPVSDYHSVLFLSSQG